MTESLYLVGSDKNVALGDTSMESLGSVGLFSAEAMGGLSDMERREKKYVILWDKVYDDLDRKGDGMDIGDKEVAELEQIGCSD